MVYNFIGSMNRQFQKGVMDLNGDKINVSIIVPVYNVEQYIERCLKSLVEQTCSCNYEIVIVNDGTKDNSMEIVRRFADEYKFIKIIEQENGGLSSARNTGIANAIGEYIAFVDSDDFVSPDYIKLLYESAVKNDSDVVYSNYCNIMDESGRKIGNFPKHKKGVFDAEKILKQTLQDITVRSYVWNKLYRRRVFTDNDLEFPIGINFEDFVVMPQVFYHSERVSFIPQSLYNYVHREGSITGSLCKKDIKNYLIAFSMLRGFMEEKGIYDKYKFTYWVLSKKIDITIYGMLIRCWSKDPKNTYVVKNYLKSRNFLKLYTSKDYSRVSSSHNQIEFI